MFKFKINNFRSYKEQEFDFSRVNILIGENSGGKSSLIKSLLALKQSIENPEISNLILNGKYADLGNFKETINNHNEKLDLEFTFSFKEELPGYARWFIFDDFTEVSARRDQVEQYIAEALKYETSVTYKINKDLDKHDSIKTIFKNKHLGELQIDFSKNYKEDEPYELITRMRLCTLVYYSKTKNKTITLEKIEYSKKGFMSIVDGTSVRKAANKIDDESLFYELAIFLINQNLVEYNLNNIKYLNPLSSNPKRIYLNKDSQSEYEKSDLEKFTNLITTNQVSSANIKKFDKILKEYGIADGIIVNSSKNLPVTELRVNIKNLVSNIFDVGYGVSLQIPMIFEAFIAEQEGGSTFVIEQPEVHLHPKLQAKFIDTLLKLGDKNKYIIETHSEHIVRMIQIIAKNKLHKVSNKEIRVYYFSRGEDKFLVSEHKLDKNGIMENEFPSGFYDTSYNLTKKLMF